jgi:DNA (cytosine-5)-methyltransferase 1
MTAPDPMPCIADTCVSPLSCSPPPRREAGQGIARPVDGGAASRGWPADVGSTLNAHYGDKWGLEDQHINEGAPLFVAHALRAQAQASHRADSETYVAHSLRADGFDASEDGTGRGTPLVPVVAKTLTRGAESAGKGGYAGRRQEDDDNLVALPFDTTQITSKANRSNPQPGDPCHPLAAGAHAPAVAFTCSEQSNAFAWERDVYPTLDAHPQSDTSNIQKGIRQGWAVRRLTPTECERLQGFPDGYSAVTYRGKPAADGPRYKALGNSMAVNVMRWIGHRIALVNSIISEQRRAA